MPVKTEPQLRAAWGHPADLWYCQRQSQSQTPQMSVRDQCARRSSVSPAVHQCRRLTFITPRVSSPPAQRRVAWGQSPASWRMLGGCEGATRGGVALCLFAHRPSDVPYTTAQVQA